MEELILGIDVGTTSLKAAVYDHQGNCMATAVVEYTLLTPYNSFVEASCEVYIKSIQKCMEKIRSKGCVNTENITAIGFSVQGETICFLDDKGTPLRNAIVWMDNRAVKQAESLRERFGNDKCYEVTGQVSFEACWPASKILWVRENEPDVFARTRHILLLEDYIIFLMTGKYVAEGSLLCSTEYWDIRTKKYWGEMLEFLGVEEDWLPEIHESGELVGRIVPEMAALLGVSSNAQVTTGCLDQAAGAIGAGVIRPGIFSENIGAALAICVPTKKLTYDIHRQMPVHYFAIPDTYMMHTFTTGGMCLRWFRDGFCKEELNVQDLTGIDAYDLMNAQAETVSAGSEGLLTLPHLQGAMAPDVNLDAKGVFYGATLKHKKPHYIRSIMESLGYIIRRNLEVIDNMGLKIDQIRTIGGGSKSGIWNQIKADITGKHLYTTQASQDAACLGAAILAGVASGVFESVEIACASMVQVRKEYIPNPDHKEIYEKQYEKYKILFNSLTDLFALDSKDKW